jgi:hypothetical protein
MVVGTWMGYLSGIALLITVITIRTLGAAHD